MTSKSYYGASFYDGQMAGSLRSAEVVLDIVFGMFKPASVVDFGCGVGPWLKAASERGVGKVLGLDGDHVQREMLLIPEADFVSCDMSKSCPSLGNRFDMAISLEVAEHLPTNRARSLVEDLTSASDVVLFSAAIPDQGGRHHCNEQFPSYWIGHFGDCGYTCYDAIRPSIWSDDRVEFWYRQNILLFSKSRVFPGRLSRPTDYDIVHPEQWRARGALGRAIDRSVGNLRHVVSRTMPRSLISIARKW